MKKILVVDDEDAIRTMLEDVLLFAGYEVVTAPNGSVAYESFQSMRNEVGLLVTDNMMPELTGKELAEKCRSEKPDLPLLFISGSLNPDIDPVRDFGQKAYMLPKPFTPIELLGTIADLLENDGKNTRK